MPVREVEVGEGPFRRVHVVHAGSLEVVALGRLNVARLHFRLQRKPNPYVGEKRILPDCLMQQRFGFPRLQLSKIDQVIGVEGNQLNGGSERGGGVPACQIIRSSKKPGVSGGSEGSENKKATNERVLQIAAKNVSTRHWR